MTEKNLENRGFKNSEYASRDDGSVLYNSSYFKIFFIQSRKYLLK